MKLSTHTMRGEFYQLRAPSIIFEEKGVRGMKATVDAQYSD
jgi:hypothetical protein